MVSKLLEMKEISKSFPGVQALSDVSFDLQAGEVHALIGENGAGKSTLMKILTGIYQKDFGCILLEGKETDITNPRIAQNLGINMIHQELNLMPDLTVAQNIFIGREPHATIPLFLNDKKMNKKAQELLDHLHLNLNPKEKVADLTVAKQQMVEIVKALSFNAKILIMDEPSSALTDTEINSLFSIIHTLKKRGVGVVYISHRMEELMYISDRITVMRDGTYVGTKPTNETSIDQIISMMVGRQIYQETTPQFSYSKEEKVLEVKGLNQGKFLKDISFYLKKGEILGFSGLMGAGRTEVARAIFGADRISSGDIYIHGKKVNIKQPHDAVKNGIGYLSEDRKQFGIITEMDVKTNISIASFSKFQRYKGWMNDGRITIKAKEMVEKLNIKTPSVNQEVRYLSGGNQQKAVIGKWLTKDCDILIFDEPTRGIDVGAKGEIYKLLNELVSQGKSIIMISSELPEILRMSHRIIVMCEGRITGELSSELASQEAIMNLATKRIS